MKKRQTLEILAVAHTEVLTAILCGPDADSPDFAGEKKKGKKRKKAEKRRKRREEAD